MSKTIFHYLKKSVPYVLLFMMFFRTVSLTAYTPYENGGSRTTASGAEAAEGITCAADYIGGYHIPFGTRIIFPDGQTFTVQDRFGAKHNDRVDIFMESYDRALRFGRRVFEVQVIIPD